MIPKIHYFPFSWMNYSIQIKLSPLYYNKIKMSSVPLWIISIIRNSMEMVLRAKKPPQKHLIECNADEYQMQNKGLFPPVFWVYAKVYLLNKSFEIMVIVYPFQVKKWILSRTLFTFANFISCHLIKDAKFNAIQRQFPWSLTTSFQWNAVEKGRWEEL